MKWIDKLKSSLGAKDGQSAPPTTKAALINYSIPTVAADSLTFVTPTQATFEGAPQFHEDEWCQIEFLPASGLNQLQSSLTEYKAFEQVHRLQYGWDQIYARKVPRSVLIKGPDAVQWLAGLFGTTPFNAPILTTASRALGQVEGSFSIRPSSDVTLFGLADERGISALGAIVSGDDMQLSQVFMKLHKAENLLLVDWRGQLILCSVEADGKFVLWRP